MLTNKLKSIKSILRSKIVSSLNRIWKVNFMRNLDAEVSTWQKKHVKSKYLPRK